MRKEKRPFLGLQEPSSFNQVHSLHINQILDENHSVRKIEPRSFLDPESLDKILQSIEESLMHAPLIAHRSNFSEEKTRNLRKIERELIGHKPKVKATRLIKYLYQHSVFALKRAKQLPSQGSPKAL